jgi:hypothetical protein
MSQKPVRMWVQQQVAADGTTVQPGTYPGREVALGHNRHAYFLTISEAEVQVTDHVIAGTIAVTI